MESATPATVHTLNDQLLKALAAEHWSDAQSALDAGADINHRASGKGRTPLLLFAARGDASACEWLLQHGADGSARTEAGSSAVHLAFQMDNRTRSDKTIDALIRNGAAVDLPDAVGSRPLHAALSYRHGEAVARRLIAAGANIETPTQLGTTPLMCAATFGKPQLLLDLLDMGADPTPATYSEGKTLLHAVIEGDTPEILPKVLQKISKGAAQLINQPTRSGTSPLAMAAARGDAANMIALIEFGADPNARSANRMEEGATPLMILAAVDGTGKGVAKALSAGARAADRDNYGRNALAFAIGRARWEAARALLEGGADPGAPLDRQGLSPYLVALMGAGTGKGQAAVPKTRKEAKELRQAEILEMVEAFHRLGFPLEPAVEPGPMPPDAEKMASPLSMAYTLHNWEVADRMVSFGARPDALDAQGQTPLHALARFELSQTQMAAIQIQGQRVRRQEEATALEESVKELQKEMEQKRIEAIGRLVPGSFSPDALDAKGKTAMAVAAGRGSQGVVGALLAQGGSPLCAGPNAEHAVSTALTAGHAAIFHGLWQRAGVRERCEDLLLRAAYTSPENYARRQGFLDLVASMGPGPWVDARDADGNTPLIVAAATLQEDLIEVLLGLGASPNLQNAAGETALMHAVEQGKGDIVRLLRGAGADASLARLDGETVADIARRARDEYVYRALEADVSELPAPAQRRLAETVTQAMEEGATLWPAPSPHARTPRP